MSGLKVITSHSMTSLASALAEDLSAAPAAMFQQERIIVLNRGMARWISAELALRNGICAGTEFLFPNEIIDNCFSAFIPRTADDSPYSREIMVWRIAATLPELAAESGFEQVAAYLGQGSDDRHLLQISRTLADLFDQYIIFRPQMIINWDKGIDNNWQARLWRAISAAAPDQHRAALLNRFSQLVSQGHQPNLPLPEKISIFGISYLPPFHLDTFSLLAQFCQVNLYLQTPCNEYWGDITPRRRLPGIAMTETEPAEDYYETGNPLLSSLGTMGQEFHNLLLEYGFESSEADRDKEQQPATILEQIQQDIRLLHDSSSGDKSPAREDDRSVQIHSCHGRLREMEVLYDNLLATFDELDSLEPRQIVVMIPDIEGYAPYISAIFGTASGGRPAIPFTIADNSGTSGNKSIQAFMRILGLATGRFSINQILELLESEPVLRRFAISEEELDGIRGWLAETGVAWGFDASDRSRLNFAGYGDFSWQAALDRLFLGYAMPDENDRLYNGILPYAGIEGRAAAPLGKLAEFLLQARSAAKRIAGSQTIDRWAETLKEIINDMLADDDSGSGNRILLQAIQSLQKNALAGGFEERISLAAIQECLTTILSSNSAGQGFAAGAVTFCAMLPMRSIPFRVICLAGMNDASFPRSRQQPAFSLMAGQRHRGDRSLRDEDRYLFLEALLAARERLLISYNGQSDRDNSSIPASVVVCELADYIEHGFTTEQDGEAPAILYKHLLQAFSPEYFHPRGQLFSYASEIRDALNPTSSHPATSLNFIETPLPDTLLACESIELRDLRLFLRNPAEAFITRRLKTRIHPLEETLDEREPFSIDGLTGYTIRQELVAKTLCGEAPDKLYETLRAKALLPPLVAGRAAFEELMAEALEFARSIAPLIGGALSPLKINFSANGMKLTGTLDKINPDRHILWRCAQMKAKDRLQAWLDHLLLNATTADGFPRTTLLICKDMTLELAPLTDAAEQLQKIIGLYCRGMNTPLHFFPQSSWLFLNEGIDKARSYWDGNSFTRNRAESSDRYYELCFGATDPLDEQFEAVAAEIFEPLMASGRETVRQTTTSEEGTP